MVHVPSPVHDAANAAAFVRRPRQHTDDHRLQLEEPFEVGARVSGCRKRCAFAVRRGAARSRGARGRAAWSARHTEDDGRYAFRTGDAHPRSRGKRPHHSRAGAKV